MNLKKILDYRSILMACAMLMIVVFHTELPALQYNFIYRNLHIGVDFFLFLSGIGIVQSLSKNNSMKEFYKRRVIRIIPTVFPLIVGFSYLMLIFNDPFGSKEFYLQITTFNFWLFKGNYPVFMWYIPCIMLYYLLSPFLYKILEKQKRDKEFWIKVILWLLILYLIPAGTDNLTIRNIFSRLPIYIVGMIYGFRIQAKEEISKKEIIGILLMVIPSVLLIHFLENDNVIYTNQFLFAGYIPIVLATVIIITYCWDKWKLKSELLEMIGASTLAIYGSQEFIRIICSSILAKNNITYNVYIFGLVMAIVSIIFGILWSKGTDYLYKKTNH